MNEPYSNKMKVAGRIQQWVPCKPFPVNERPKKGWPQAFYIEQWAMESIDPFVHRPYIAQSRLSTTVAQIFHSIIPMEW